MLLALTRFAVLGRRLAAASIILLAICAFSPVGNILIYPLEQRFPPWDAAEGPPDGVIVLGGPIDVDVSEARHTPVVRNGADRLFAAAALARRYPHAKIVFTGGNANLVATEAKEADYAGTLLESFGIARERLILERQSRNTYENALFTRELVKPKPGERWLLVTSAYHMPRSVGLFRNVGFAVEAYPVDWRERGRAGLYEFTNMSVEGLVRTETAMREWIGLVAYRLSGKTSELLPGPATD